MTDEIIPAAEKLAAKRAFIRTTYQAYAATLSTGLPSAAAIVTLIQDSTGWLLAGITVGLALVSPLVAGAAAYAQNRGGLPQEYRDATLVAQAALPDVDRDGDQQAAVARVLLRRDLKG